MRDRGLVRALVIAMTCAAVIFGTSPANAGDTRRVSGCAAHWRNTAAWNECQEHSSQPVEVRLHVACSAQPDWAGAWRLVKGYIDPLDRHECRFSAQSAYNAFR